MSNPDGDNPGESKPEVKEEPLKSGGILQILCLSALSLITLYFLLGSKGGVLDNPKEIVFGSRVGHLTSNRNEPGKDVTLDAGGAGRFIGRKTSFFAFRSIPYAKAPFRWAEPQPPPVKRAPVDTREVKPPCSQWDSVQEEVIGSQNCLHLTVFTPKLPPREGGNFSHLLPRELNKIFLPVLVYFHGGEYQRGAGTNLEPENLMESGKVVVITVNFRLGVMGFLSGGDLAGNYGLLDQIQALKWVNEHISKFGGSAKRVTIFGEVRHLLFSPLSRPGDLYQRAIINSGPFPTILSSGNLELLLKVTNCPEINSDDASYTASIECLRLKDPEELISKALEANLQFGPVIDAELRDFPLIPTPPEAILADEQMEDFIPKIPILVGVNQLEEFERLRRFMNKYPGFFNSSEEKPDISLKDALFQEIFHPLDGDFPHRKAWGAIWESYSSNDGGMSVGKILQMFSDVRIHVPQVAFLSQLIDRTKSPVYNYVFTYRMDEADEEDAILEFDGVDTPPWNDIRYISGPKYGEEETEVDRFMRKIMRQIWVSFALFGTPKFGLENLGNWTKWDRNWSNKEIRYYEIDWIPHQMGRSFRENATILFSEIVPNLINEGDTRSTFEKLTAFWTQTIWTTMICVILLVFIISFSIFLAFYKIFQIF